MDVHPFAGEPIDAEYVTVGHITIDVPPGGAPTIGGSVFFSALYAARAGLRAAILTAGRLDALTESLSEHDEPVAVHVIPSACTTRLRTEGDGAERRQQLIERAEPIPVADVTGDIVHLAPVVGELDRGWLALPAPRLALTAQGFLREVGPDGWIRVGPNPVLRGHRARWVVVSEVEEDAYTESMEGPDDAVVVVTARDRPAVLRERDRLRRIAAFPVEERDERGAGDVFAAAFFIAMREGGDAAEAVRVAHAAAALRVSQRGPSGVPTREAVLQFLTQHEATP